MGDILSDIAGAAESVEKEVLPSASSDIAKIGGATITAGELETATGSLQAFLTAMRTAIAAKNYPVAAELTVSEALTAAKDVGIGGTPVAIAAIVLPILFDAINSGKLNAGSLSDNAGERQPEQAEHTIGIGMRP